MKRNTFIRVLSVTMAAGVLLGSYGCKKDSANAPKDETTLGNTTSQSELSSVTSIIEYTSVDKKGKEKQATNVEKIVIPSINQAVLGPKLSEKFEDEKDAKEKFKKNISSYGADEKKSEEIIKEAENWQIFTYDYFVTNPTSKRIAFRGMSGTAKDGILVNYDFGCEIGIASGKGTYILIEGMVDKNKFKDEAAIKEALKSMNLQIEYTNVKSVDETVDDWSKVETKKLPIDISR